MLSSLHNTRQACPQKIKDGLTSKDGTHTKTRGDGFWSCHLFLLLVTDAICHLEKKHKR